MLVTEYWQSVLRPVLSHTTLYLNTVCCDLFCHIQPIIYANKCSLWPALSHTTYNTDTGRCDPLCHIPPLIYTDNVRCDLTLSRVFYNTDTGRVTHSATYSVYHWHWSLWPARHIHLILRHWLLWPVLSHTPYTLTLVVVTCTVTYTLYSDTSHRDLYCHIHLILCSYTVIRYTRWNIYSLHIIASVRYTR